MSALYVILKLTSGEQVMSILKEEDDEYILLEDPMCIKTIPVLESGKEHITAAPLCHFTADREFVINKRNVLFVKKMHHLFIPHYIRIVDDHMKSDVFQPAEEPSDSLIWEDDFTPETAAKAVEQLKNIFGDETKEEEVDWESKLRNLVQGNDTIN